MSPLKRSVIISLISGLISGAIVTAIIWFVLSSAWFFFIIPLVMGGTIKKFAHITAKEVEDDENLQSKVGWTCAGITLFFVLFTALATILIFYIISGSFVDTVIGSIVLNIGFFAASGVAVWYGYRCGVQAVMDSYYDSNMDQD